MMREADLMLWIASLDALVRHPMGAQQVHEDPGGGAQVTRPRRPVAAEIALVGNHGRLVDRDPQACEVSKFVRDARGEPGKVVGCFRGVPAAGLRDPGWVGEVVQGDDRLHAAGTQSLKDIPIMRDRRRRKLPGRRLDPRPLERKSMRVLMQRSQQVKITRVTFKLLAGTVRPVAVLDMPRHLFPGPPVVGMVATLDLMRRRGRAPKKFLRKAAGDHGCWAMIANTMPRIISASSRTNTAPMGPTTAATARSVDIP